MSETSLLVRVKKAHLYETGEPPAVGTTDGIPFFCTTNALGARYSAGDGRTLGWDGGLVQADRGKANDSLYATRNRPDCNQAIPIRRGKLPNHTVKPTMLSHSTGILTIRFFKIKTIAKNKATYSLRYILDIGVLNGLSQECYYSQTKNSKKELTNSSNFLYCMTKCRQANQPARCQYVVTETC